MKDVVSTKKNAEEILRKLLVNNIGQFDEDEEQFIRAVANKCFENKINPEWLIDDVINKIHKYRQEKLLREIRMAQVEAGENAVIESLRRRGL